MSASDLRHILARLHPRNQASLRATSQSQAVAVRNAQTLLFQNARSDAHVLVSLGVMGGTQVHLLVSPCSKEYKIQLIDQTSPRSQNAVHFTKTGRPLQTSRRMLIHHFSLYAYWLLLDELSKRGAQIVDPKYLQSIQSIIVFPRDQAYAVDAEHAFSMYIGEKEMVGNWDMFFTTKLYRKDLNKSLYGPDRWKELLQQHIRHYINFRVGPPKRIRGRRARMLSKVMVEES